MTTNSIISEGRRKFIKRTLGASVAAAAIYFASGALNVVKSANKKKSNKSCS